MPTDDRKLRSGIVCSPSCELNESEWKGWIGRGVFGPHPTPFGDHGGKCTAIFVFVPARIRFSCKLLCSSMNSKLLIFETITYLKEGQSKYFPLPYDLYQLSILLSLRLIKVSNWHVLCILFKHFKIKLRQMFEHNNCALKLQVIFRNLRTIDYVALTFLIDICTTIILRLVHD